MAFICEGVSEVFKCLQNHQKQIKSFIFDCITGLAIESNLNRD